MNDSAAPWWRRAAARVEWVNVVYLAGIILAGAFNNLLAAGMWTIGCPLGYGAAALQCAKERRALTETERDIDE